MAGAGERLKEARRLAGFDKATEAARRFGWNPHTYKAHENGARGLRPDAAERYARRFRVAPAWLLGLTNEGGPSSRLREAADATLILGAENQGVDPPMPMADQKKMVRALIAANRVLEGEQLTEEARAEATVRLQILLYRFIEAQEVRGNPVSDDLLSEVIALMRARMPTSPTG
jgi:transcriptional regulator with XRE-family HTH domain